MEFIRKLAFSNDLPKSCPKLPPTSETVLSASSSISSCSLGRTREEGDPPPLLPARLLMGCIPPLNSRGTGESGMPFLQCRLAIPFPMSPQMSSKAQSLPAVAPLCPSHAYAASLGDLLPAPSFPCTAFFPEEVSVPSGRAARCPAKYRHPGHGQRPNVAVVGGRGCRPRIPPGTRSSSRVVAAACVHMYARVC